MSRENLFFINLIDLLNYGGDGTRKYVEGENVLDASHILHCGLTSNTENKVNILCLVVKSSGIYDVPHEVKVEIKIENNMKTISGTCSCKGGLSGTCKHCIAVLIHITRTKKYEFEIATCTDVRQKWGKLKKNVESLYETVPSSQSSGFWQSVNNKCSSDCVSLSSTLFDSTTDIKHRIMAAPISTAMDSLSAALKSNIIPNQEYLLQGSVLDSAVEVLLHRLRGLCDNVDSGPETFHDHEMCFSIRRGPPPEQPLLLRVRRALDYQDMPWQLRYIGQPELGDKSRPTIVRSSIDIATSNSVVEFLTELGCRLDFEYIVRGYMFRKGRMKVTVSKIFKMGQGKLPESVEPISQSYLVELSVLAPSGQDAIAEDMRIFAEQLRPLVQLEKIDYKRLVH